VKQQRLFDLSEVTAIDTQHELAEYHQLEEAVVNKQAGTIELTVIREGFNTSKSRYYTDKALRETGPQVFEGAKMYLNHPTETDKVLRPEGDLGAWVGVLREVTYDEEGKRLRGKAKVIDPAFLSKVKLLQDAGELEQLGVSIRASGIGYHDEIDGHPTVCVESFVAAASVDFVTEPGAGGRAHALTEADVMKTLTVEVIKEQRPDLVAELTGGIDMAEVDELRQQLEEANRARTEAEQRAQEAEQKAKEAEQKASDAELREAKRKVQEELEEALSSVTLPEPIVKRIRERFKDAETIEGIAEAIKEEQDYLRELSGSGVVTGLGESEKEEGEGGGIDLSESFKAFGLSDDAAKVAAAGRD